MLTAILMGLLTGVLGILAYPDPALWPLAFVAYVPLLAATFGRRKGVRFLAGWTAGTVLHLGVYHWIYDTAVNMSSLSPVLATLVLLAFALAHGLCQALIALVADPIRAYSGSLWVLTVPAAAVVVEAVFPHLFPWFLGNALYRQVLLTQVADLTGIYGLSYLCFASAAVLVLAWERARSGGARAAARPVAVLAGVLVAVVAYGAARISMVESTEPYKVLRVALLQPFMTGEEKGDLKGWARKKLYHKSLVLLRMIRGDELDAAILPEGGFPFFFMPEVEGAPRHKDEPPKVAFSRAILEEIRALGVDVVFGSLRVPADGRTRNSAVFVDPKAGAPVLYDKRRLVAFGEYMPLSDVFPSLKNAVKNVSDFKPGDRHVVFRIGGVTLEPTICYEAIFPSFVRTAVNQEPRADAILNLTNDVWFGETSAPELHLMVQVDRAVELRLPLIRSTNSGISAIVDQTGAITDRTPVYEAAVLRAEVPVRHIYSFYRQFGDVFLWGAGLGTLVVVVLGFRRRRRALT